MCSKETHGASSGDVFVHPRSQKGQVMKDHPLGKVIGDISTPMKTRRNVSNKVNFYCYVSYLEPKNVIEALEDDSWINAMHEELE